MAQVYSMQPKSGATTTNCVNARAVVVDWTEVNKAQAEYEQIGLDFAMCHVQCKD